MIGYVLEWILLTIIAMGIFKILGVEITFNSLLLATIVWGFGNVCETIRRK